ncbi:hypothetical protein [Microcoleus sp. B4-C2]|uniref:hypothetical protein n=1 Tax=Microcoleus sp. B4-C2 TaxID=2818661 RepID=UPI0040406DD1
MSESDLSALDLSESDLSESDLSALELVLHRYLKLSNSPYFALPHSHRLWDYSD